MAGAIDPTGGEEECSRRIPRDEARKGFEIETHTDTNAIIPTATKGIVPESISMARRRTHAADLGLRRGPTGRDRRR
jgi:hypothetical protein